MVFGFYEVWIWVEKVVKNFNFKEFDFYIYCLLEDKLDFVINKIVIIVIDDFFIGYKVDF